MGDVDVGSPAGAAARYRLIGPDGKEYASSRPGTLGGHRRNRIYGTLDCPGALSWIAKGKYVKQRVFFGSEEHAQLAGYRPCSVCMPQEYRRWKSAKVTAPAPSGEEI